MLSLLELKGPKLYVWQPSLLTVSKSYPAEAPLLRLRARESLCGEETMKCPLWMTCARPTGLQPVSVLAQPSSGSDSDSESAMWAGFEVLENFCDILSTFAMARFSYGSALFLRVTR